MHKKIRNYPNLLKNYFKHAQLFIIVQCLVIVHICFLLPMVSLICLAWGLVDHPLDQDLPCFITTHIPRPPSVIAVINDTFICFDIESFDIAKYWRNGKSIWTHFLCIVRLYQISNWKIVLKRYKVLIDIFCVSLIGCVRGDLYFDRSVLFCVCAWRSFSDS